MIGSYSYAGFVSGCSQSHRSWTMKWRGYDAYDGSDGYERESKTPHFGPTTTSHWNCGVSVRFLCLSKDWIQPRQRIGPSLSKLQALGLKIHCVVTVSGTNLEFNSLKQFQKYSKGLSGMKLQAGLRWRDKLYSSLGESICEFCRSGLTAHGQTIAVGPPCCTRQPASKISLSFFRNKRDDLQEVRERLH